MPNLTSLRVFRALIISIAVIAAGCGPKGSGQEETAVVPPPAPVEDCNPPYRITNEGINEQIGFAGQMLSSKLTVQVTCGNSNEQAGSGSGPVTWTVVSGGGLINGVPTLTSFDRSVQWQLGPTLGVQEVRADYTDPSKGTLSSTTFQATAIASVAGCSSSAAGTPQAPSPGDRYITHDETWGVALSPHRGGTVHVSEGAVLTIEAGAEVCVKALYMEGGRLVAQGQAGAPIVFTAADPSKFGPELVFYSPLSGIPLARPSILSFVDIQNPFSFFMSGGHPVEIRDSRVSRLEANTLTGYCPSWHLGLSDGYESSVVERVVVERFGGPGCPAVQIVTDNISVGIAFSVGARVLRSGGDAVHVQTLRGSVELSSCEISGSAGDGLVWTDGPQSFSVSSCNITGNTGVGIRNTTISGQLMARDNWWGDAAGPGGLNGDGVAGNVDAASPRAAPVSLGY